MPRLSVILPALDAQDTIGQAVASTLRGLAKDAELVVLDDGSTDQTAECATAAGQGDPRLRVVSRPPSGGIAKALNWLIDNTDSKLVARMDADDIGLPWRFASALRAVDEGSGRGADFVFNQVLYTDGKRLRPSPPLPISPQAFPLHLLLTNPVSHPTMVATRASLEALGGYRDVPAEDYDLWLRAASRGMTLRRLGTWGLKYRVHPTQITASTQWRSASWNDERQAAAFRDLASSLCGKPLERVVAIAQLPEPARAAALAEFSAAVESALAKANLNRFEAAVLRRRLNSRLQWAKSYQPQKETR